MIKSLAVLLLLVQSVQGIYEDQAGEFDWSVQNLGRVVAVAYGGGDKRSAATSARGSGRAVYVASDSRSRALARLDAKTGAIKWRNVLYADDAVDAIELTNYGLLSLSGGGKNVRMWDAVDGSLVWDNVVFGADKSSSTGDVVPIGDDRAVVLSLNTAVFMNLKDGRVSWRAELPAATSAIESSVVSSDGSALFVLVQSAGKHQVLSLDVASGGVTPVAVDEKSEAVVVRKSEKGEAVFVVVSASEIKIQSLESSSKSKTTLIGDLALPASKTTQRFAGVEAEVKNGLTIRLASGKRVYCSISDSFELKAASVLSEDGVVVESSTEDAKLFHVTASTQKQVQVASYSHNAQTSRTQWEAEVDVNLHGGAVSSAFAACPTRKKDSGAPRCRVLLVMRDDGLIMTTNEEPSDSEVSVETAKNVLWTREESLANVKETLWITPAETQIEKQPLKGIPSFVEDLQLDIERLQQFVQHAMSMSSSLFEPKSAGDHKARKEPENAHFFGFSKYLLALTESGRLFAIRAETNTVAWSSFVGPAYRLFVLRDHPVLGSGAELLLVSNSTQLSWVDGDDGRQIESVDASSNSNAWVVILPKRKHHIDEDTTIRRAVAVVSKDSLDVSIFPEEAASVGHPEAENFYFYRYDESIGAFHGYTIDKVGDKGYKARQVWSVVVPSDQKLVATSRQRENAVIDSSVTITGDDSLLLKYLNPHMFGLTTLSHEKLEGSHKTTPVLHVSLVDSVTGRLIHRVRHVHGSEPVQMVQSEHWVVYTYWNSKDKRTELVSLSLYDGAVGTHSLNLWKRPSWNEVRSSYDPRAPFVLQKSFVFPAKISTLGVTVTSRGITPQYVLVGMENGQVFKLSRALINPRQPEKPPTPEEQNEGLGQYSPLIPLHHNLYSMVTYNQTVANLKAISTTPVELESTTLMVAHGLDMFYVRMAPAKAFDVLPPDFNYELLVLLCLGFLGAAYVAKGFAQRKALNEAWK
ncbi:hypothetical protein Poli38472_008440 [Pythium oligandrum]|uniref:ER membrane protein complex subunit 1 n=1 Tax=Pythium oligandrum TaxID=41045 RepID=A0A8K1CP22_PYTOL|nr:hypothetical protein Poli38472_008440 [Pythium oligandrum]|eukprot:TMW65798.1 hypothetical protein Poli38472_008440 [Pythium oligandrum]